MKSKSLLALALALATIGLSFPAIAGNQDGNNHLRADRRERQDNSNKRRPSYYGKYHYHQMSDGSFIYIGSKGDYWQGGKYYPDTNSNDYEKYYDPSYDYSKGDYYEDGSYKSKKQLRKSSNSYYGKYHYYQMSDGSVIYIGSKGDYWQGGKYYRDTDSNNYEKYYDSSYDYSKGDYYENGNYNSKR